MNKGKDALKRLTSDNTQMDCLSQLLLLRNYKVDTDAVAVAILTRLRAERVWFVGNAHSDPDANTLDTSDN